MPKKLPFSFYGRDVQNVFLNLKQAWFSGGWAGGNTRSSLVTGELVHI